MLKSIDPGGDIEVMNRYAKDTPHGSLHHLWAETLDRIGATDQLLNAEPVSRSDDGAKVSGVL
jgi:hypothetical protein